MLSKKVLLSILCSFFVIASFANTPPKAVNDTVAICKNSSLDSIFVLKNDKDINGDSIFIKQIINNPTNGLATSDGKNIIYTPNSNFHGSDVIYLQVCDNGTPSLCAYSFVLITVDTCYPKNHAPIAKDDSLGACKNQQNELLVNLNDSDLDADSIYIKKLYRRSTHGNDSLGTDGRVFYTPYNGFVGADSISYILCDKPQSINMQPACDTAMIRIYVIQCPGYVNNAPTATLDIVPGVEDFGGLPFDPRSNDTDPDGDPLTWTAVNVPILGAGPYNGKVVTFGSQWRYIPNKDFNGVDLMPYQVCDNGTPKKCAFSVVTFVIVGTNDPPVAKDDSFAVLEDTPTILPVANNDVDVDGDVLTATITYPPAHGTAQVVNGNQVLYTPNANYSGEDAFSYQVCDSSGKCSSAFVKITVLPVNDLPVAVSDSVSFRETESALSVNVLSNDSDEEGDAFAITNAWGSANFMAHVVDKDGKQVLEIMKLDNTYCGDDSVHYEICASNGCDTATVYMHAKCKFDAFLPEGISPNGDGKNDLLVFPFSKDSHPFELRIYNRYGAPVYVNEDYQNDWDGTSFDTKKPLPDGSYWYTVELSDGKKFVNYCVIQR
jgi:gliding motility-associated-like protein